MKVRAELASPPIGILKLNFQDCALGNLTQMRIGSLFQEYKCGIF